MAAQKKKRLHKKELFRFDHIAVPVGDKKGDLEKFSQVFKLLGFKQEWYRKRIGNKETAMKTAVMTRGDVKFALMEGIDGKNSKGKKIISQVNEYYRRFGIAPQHIAIRCANLKKLVGEWHKKGVRFLTEDDKGYPAILRDEDEEGRLVLQCFTYPINKSWFFELKQIVAKKDHKLRGLEEFRDDNVRGLWASLNKALKEGWLFDVNIFGEKKK